MTSMGFRIGKEGIWATPLRRFFRGQGCPSVSRTNYSNFSREPRFPSVRVATQPDCDTRSAGISPLKSMLELTLFVKHHNF
jgi:hypothetical protein